MLTDGAWPLTRRPLHPLLLALAMALGWGYILLCNTQVFVTFWVFHKLLSLRRRSDRASRTWRFPRLRFEAWPRGSRRSLPLTPAGMASKCAWRMRFSSSLGARPRTEARRLCFCWRCGERWSSASAQVLYPSLICYSRASTQGHKVKFQNVTFRFVVPNECAGTGDTHLFVLSTSGLFLRIKNPGT